MPANWQSSSEIDDMLDRVLRGEITRQDLRDCPCKEAKEALKTLAEPADPDCTFDVEFMVINANEKPRLIILDKVPSAVIDTINVLDEQDPQRMVIIESLQKELGFCDIQNFDDGIDWSDIYPGIYIRRWDEPLNRDGLKHE